MNVWWFLWFNTIIESRQVCPNLLPVTQPTVIRVQTEVIEKLSSLDLLSQQNTQNSSRTWCSTTENDRQHTPKYDLKNSFWFTGEFVASARNTSNLSCEFLKRASLSLTDSNWIIYAINKLKMHGHASLPSELEMSMCGETDWRTCGFHLRYTRVKYAPNDSG